MTKFFYIDLTDYTVEIHDICSGAHASLELIREKRICITGCGAVRVTFLPLTVERKEQENLKKRWPLFCHSRGLPLNHS